MLLLLLYVTSYPIPMCTVWYYIRRLQKEGSYFWLISFVLFPSQYDLPIMHTLTTEMNRPVTAFPTTVGTWTKQGRLQGGVWWRQDSASVGMCELLTQEECAGVCSRHLFTSINILFHFVEGAHLLSSNITDCWFPHCCLAEHLWLPVCWLMSKILKCLVVTHEGCSLLPYFKGPFTDVLEANPSQFYHIVAT